ncbi:MAG TPA: EamA family transporter [Gaiellaceae bacterium]|nr:EamA family transporter [Gaiellaceae bacterium]
MAGSRLGWRVWAALGTVYVVWGSTYLAIALGVETLPPLPMLGVRFLIAGSILFAWCARHGLPRTTRRQWVAAAVVGSLLCGIGNGAVGWAETRIDSGLAALIIAIVPLWIALLDRVVLGRRLAWQAVVGIAVGLAGVAFLVDPAGASSRDLIAAVALVFSSFAWAAGSLYATRAARPADPLVGVAMQMLTGGAVLCAAGVGQWTRVDLGAVSARSAGGLAYLIVIGSIVGYSAYGWLLHNAPTSLVSTYAYVNPVVAVLLGALFLSEPVTEHTLVGGGVIVVAVALIIAARPRRSDEPAASEGALEALEEAA